MSDHHNDSAPAGDIAAATRLPWRRPMMTELATLETQLGDFANPDGINTAS